MATYDGFAIFGRSVSISVLSAPGEFQRTAFNGQNGLYSLFGGQRGHVFQVEGVLYGADLTALFAARALIESYNDGLSRVLIDTAGYSWGQVVFNGDYSPAGKYTYGHGGIVQPYRCSFTGLI